MTFRTFSLSLTLRHLESQIDTYVKGHLVYKDLWNTEIGESLDAEIEPNNPVDKYAVCIRKSGKVVGDLKKGAVGRFSKTLFFFLKGDPYTKTKTRTSGCRCDLGDSKGSHVPCKYRNVLYTNDI